MKKTIVFLFFLLTLANIVKAQKPISNTSFTGIKVPSYCASGDTSRTPFFFQAKISGFTANTQYKYFVSYIRISDTSNTLIFGAGSNLLFKSNGNIMYSSAPDFNNGNHDTLKTGSGGDFTGWFGALNTNDSRFTAGNYVYPMIVLQEIKAGSPPIQKYYLKDSIKVLAYSNTAGANNGTGIWGNSYGGNKKVVALYNDTTGTSSRPVAITFLETDLNTIAKVPSFYSKNVNGVNGAWGAIIPNTLSNGIRRIEVREPFGGNSVTYANKELDATWGFDSTINPKGGLNAIRISSDNAPLRRPEIQFVSAMTYVNEAFTTLKILVRRNYGNSDSSKISFSLSSGTATQGQDFTVDTTKQLKFKPYGNLTDTINVSILNDSKIESTESLTLKLVKPINCNLGLNTTNQIDIYDAQKPKQDFFFTGMKVPQYCASGDTTRTPIVYQARIAGFSANTSYKYYVSFIVISDTSSSTTTGAGNDLFFKSNGNVVYSTGLGFTPGNHDTFTIPFNGDFTGWFGALNNNDSRFTAGKYIYPMIVMQEIDTIVRPIQKFYLTDSIMVLRYSPSAGSTNGTGIYGNSFAKSKNFVLLYDNVLGISPRPITTAYLENDANTITKMPYFYNNKVNGINGAWGSIIPNTLSNGIKRIELIDPKSLSIFEYANKESDATWGSDSTINPRGGSKPVHIKSDYAPLVAPDIQFVSGITNVNEANTTIKLAVKRKYGNDDSTKVTYFVSGATATPGTDYTFNTGKTLVFKPYGDQIDTVTITMNILDDIQSDPNEYILVKLSTPQNGNIGLQSVNTVNIVDNDIPVIYFAQKGIKVSETNGNLKVKVKLNISPSTPTNVKLFVKYKGDSTAIPAEFKIGTSNKDTTIQFAGIKYNDSIDVKVPIINDNFTENHNDTIILVLRNPTAPATIGKDSLYTLVITDEDAPPIYSFAKKSISLKENGGNVSFRINITGRNANQSDINLRFLQPISSATQGTDLTFSPTTKIISVAPTDPDSLIVTVPILNDNTFENNETAVFIITNSLNARIGKPDTLRISISDDDMVEYPISKVTTVKPGTGVADSLNAKCKLRGVVYGVNLKPAGTPNGFLFTLIDPTGGIQVINSTGNKGYTVTEGDSIYVIGTIGQFEGMIQLQNIDSLVKMASGRTLKSAAVTTVLNESTESKLVKLNTVKLVNPAQWPSTALGANTIALVDVANQTSTYTMLIDSESDLDGTPAPAGFMNVTGLGGQSDPTNPYASGYVIVPRRLTDIQLLLTPVFGFTTATSSTSEKRDSTTVFTLTATNIVSNQQISIVLKGGTATRNVDYEALSTTRTYILTPTQPSVNVYVKLKDDLTNELPETIIWAIRDNPFGTLIGADSIHTQTIVDNETVSVADILANETMLYPNPAKDVINISTTSLMRKISIIDVNGRIVYTLDQINSQNTIIDTEKLAKGFYTISIDSEKGMITKTFTRAE